MCPSYERFVSEINNAPDTTHLQDIFLNKIKEHGFDLMALCLNSDHKEFGLKAGIGIQHNYPPEFLKMYHDNDLIKIDPVQTLARFKNKAFSWEQTRQEMKLSPKQKYFLDLLPERGFHNGYYVPLWGHNTLAGVGFSRSNKIYDHNISVDLEMMTSFCRLYYNRFLGLHQKVMPKQRATKFNLTLTGREAQILKLAARGCRDSQIAELLHLSTHTVDAHFRGIYRKLSANTRAEAVAEALALHLIWI